MKSDRRSQRPASSGSDSPSMSCARCAASMTPRSRPTSASSSTSSSRTKSTADVTSTRSAMTLTREVVYDDLLVRERKRLHRAVADALSSARDTRPRSSRITARGRRPRARGSGARKSRRSRDARGCAREAPRTLRARGRDRTPRSRARLGHRATGGGIPALRTALSIKDSAGGARLVPAARRRRGQSRMLRLEGRGHFYEARQGAIRGAKREAIDVLAGEPCIELARATAALAGLLMTRKRYGRSDPSCRTSDRHGRARRRRVDPRERAHHAGQRTPWAAGCAIPPSRLDVALREGVHEAAQRGYKQHPDLTDRARRECVRAFRTGRGRTRPRAAARARGGWSLLSLSIKSGLEFGSGDWDTMLATLGACTTLRWCSLGADLPRVGRRGAPRSGRGSSIFADLAGPHHRRTRSRSSPAEPQSPPASPKPTGPWKRARNSRLSPS